MNKVMLIGRLTADPEIRQTQSGKRVGTFTLAVDRRVSKEKEADFIRCQAWEKRAEFAEKYLVKGSKVALWGRIQTGSYNDKDGKKVYTTDVVVDEIEFADSKKSIGEDNDGFVPVPDNVEWLPFN